ncbi:alpha/beta hydrolase [Mycolicibacterium septicum]|uniref:alpha/beta hydrolase n=1 Tax=Mycolicibacterium septicum TaxID=98668 RepID=UPI0005C9C6DC|nr:alpha/beta hydrolase [Mycolicibacterium septicum]
MTVTIPQVQTSQPETLTASATELGQKASGLASRIDSQRANIDGLRSGWQGTASDAAIAKAQPTLARMQQIHDALNRAQTVIQEGGTALNQTRTSLLGAVDQLKAQGWQVAPDGTVSVRPGSALDQYAKLSPANAMQLRQLATTNSLGLKTQLANFDTSDRQLSQNLRTAVGGLDSAPQNFGPGDLPQAPPYDTGAEIPVGKSAEEVDKWWQSLSPEKREQLRKDWPEKLGNLNGIPIVDRDKANRDVWQRDLALPREIAKSRGVTEKEVLAHPEKYGLTGPTMDRYKNAVKVDEALKADAEKAKDANNKTPELLLMKYDPEAFDGEGAAAIAIGNPDKAANTTVMVSGLTTSVAAGTLADGTGASVFTEANRADPHSSTAVVQWMGYNAPDLDADLDTNAVGVTQPDMARAGAQLLAPDVNALAVTHEGSPAHTTVIGHSYGSTTVADAAAGYGMRADDIVLVGCPGTDLAQSAADFHLPPDGHLFVGAASTDFVTGLGSEHLNIPGTGLGNDPAMDGYGSTRFHAEVAEHSINPLNEHTSYFRDGSESLYSIADIVSGHGDALQDHGMTAGHRAPSPIPAWLPDFSPSVGIDPELVHKSNNDHYHTGR